MSGPFTPQLARLKAACRRAVELNGGVDGAGATAHRGRSVAGDWGNINHPAFPPADCALALDEVAVAQGHCPPILAAMASALGFVAIRLPDGMNGADELGRSLIEASAEFGDVAGSVRDATRDGKIDPREQARILTDIDEAIASLMTLKKVVEGAR